MSVEADRIFLKIKEAAQQDHIHPILLAMNEIEDSAQMQFFCQEYLTDWMADIYHRADYENHERHGLVDVPYQERALHFAIQGVNLYETADKSPEAQTRRQQWIDAFRAVPQL